MHGMMLFQYRAACLNRSDNSLGDATGFHELLPKVVDLAWDEEGGVPFRLGNANPGGSRVEGDATDAEGSGKDPCGGRAERAFAAR
jgi:nucleoid-associated protein YgaU